MIRTVIIESKIKNDVRKATFILYADSMTRQLYGYAYGIGFEGSTDWWDNKVDTINLTLDQLGNKEELFQSNIDSEVLFFEDPKITTIDH